MCVYVEEPEHPIASLDRDGRVISQSNLNVTSMGHDFNTAKIVPFVCLLCDISESVESSFYCGKVFVHLKDAIF